MKIGKAKKVNELNPEQVEQLRRGALEANTENTPEGYEIGFDTVICNPQLITDEGLEVITNIHWTTPVKELEENETPRQAKERFTNTFKVSIRPGYDMTVLKEPEMTQALDVVNVTLPDMMDFGKVVHGVIHHMTEDVYWNWKVERENELDTACCFFTLNDLFSGGRITIDPGLTYDLPRGSFLGFNNSIHTMYSMEPIYDGERFLLQLFFQRPTLEEQEALS